MADCTYRGHRCLVLAPGLLLRLEGEGAPCIEMAAPDGVGPLSLPLTAEHSAYLQGRLAAAGEYDDAEMDPKKVKEWFVRRLGLAGVSGSIPRSDAGASQLAAELTEAIVKAGELGLDPGRIREASEASIAEIIAAAAVAPYAALVALIERFLLADGLESAPSSQATETCRQGTKFHVTDPGAVKDALAEAARAGEAANAAVQGLKDLLDELRRRKAAEQLDLTDLHRGQETERKAIIDAAATQPAIVRLSDEDRQLLRLGFCLVTLAANCPLQDFRDMQSAAVAMSGERGFFNPEGLPAREPPEQPQSAPEA